MRHGGRPSHVALLSISHYAGLRLTREGIELRYVLDMAEIPTFLELQETGLVPEAGHPSLQGYLDRQTVALQDRLRVEVNGREASDTLAAFPVQHDCKMGYILDGPPVAGRHSQYGTRG